MRRGGKVVNALASHREVEHRRLDLVTEEGPLLLPGSDGVVLQ